MNIDKIIDKIDENIKNRLKDMNVSLIYLFGSVAEGKNFPFSDIDIGILFFENKANKINFSSVYNDLYDIFTDIFHGKKVDLVFLNKANLELRFDVISHGKILYQSSDEDRLLFEEKTTLLHADFRPLLKEFDKSVLEKI